ncbi:MAG: DUF3622 domain-containing protein [Gammaproteobacteria bacterium]|nr:DUF3622 domain-containing protein [Gammaproteobacteria bacterium]
MTTSKKFVALVEQDGATWIAKILRRKTARETIVSKTQDGFATQEEADKWAATELADFLKNLTAKNKRNK